jgi:hypothetical protein
MIFNNFYHFFQRISIIVVRSLRDEVVKERDSSPWLKKTDLEKFPFRWILVMHALFWSGMKKFFKKIFKKNRFFQKKIFFLRPNQKFFLLFFTK